MDPFPSRSGRRGVRTQAVCGCLVVWPLTSWAGIDGDGEGQGIEVVKTCSPTNPARLRTNIAVEYRYAAGIPPEPCGGGTRSLPPRAGSHLQRGSCTSGEKVDDDPGDVSAMAFGKSLETSSGVRGG